MPQGPGGIGVPGAPSALIAAALLAVSTAHARPPDAFAGRPTEMRAGLDARYWVWTDRAGVHLRWTTAGELRRFSGSIRAGASAVPSPVVAVSDSGEASAPVMVRAEDGSLSFTATARAGLSGLNLPPVGAEGLALSLFMDGLPAPLHAIRLGTAGIRPRRPVLTLRSPEPAQGGEDHHAHPHVSPHEAGLHHEHPHPHPHPPSNGHHHPR